MLLEFSIDHIILQVIFLIRGSHTEIRKQLVLVSLTTFIPMLGGNSQNFLRMSILKIFVTSGLNSLKFFLKQISSNGVYYSKHRKVAIFYE